MARGALSPCDLERPDAIRACPDWKWIRSALLLINCQIRMILVCAPHSGSGEITGCKRPQETLQATTMQVA
jgi:hypothetical protein